MHQEKSSPELLPYQPKLISYVTKKINEQDKEANAETRDTDHRFFLNIHKMELERVKYMLKNYLRTRIFKIEKNLLYIIEKDLALLLSEEEMKYAWELYEARKKHFTQTLFAKIPSTLNPFDQEQLDDRMSK